MSDLDDSPPPTVPEGALLRELPIINRKGLHARATAKFVNCVDQFSAEVTVTRCGETVGGTSIMGILTLGAAQGTSIYVTAAAFSLNVSQIFGFSCDWRFTKP